MADREKGCVGSYWISIFRCLVLVAVLACTIASQGQFQRFPIGHGSSTLKKKNPSARIQSLTPMVLPFWDDFSFTQESDLPNDTLWVSRHTVWVNHGTAINPPSIFTATFDGIDSAGKPHNITEVLAKGFADKLISRPIKLKDLDASQADSVYLSFFFQATGNGEAPDTDDNFSLWFLDKNGTWEKVFERGNVNLDPERFYYQNIKVDKKFFHDAFQFKFQNFARLSGPYDTWNLDYVYLNKRRKSSDNYFPDRTSVKPLTSIFKKYTAIPIVHYKDTARAVTISPTVTFFNLFKSPQPSDYSTFAKIISKTGKVSVEKNFTMDVAKKLNFSLEPKTFSEVVLNKTIPIDSLNLSADSIYIQFKLGFDSGDTNRVAETPLFFPIDFLKNDTIQSDFILHKHYAYDDGSAEYGAGLNQPGAELAYGFDMFTKKIDTIQFVDIYFPEFGDNSNQTLILKLWSSGNLRPKTELYRQTITVNRKSGQRFFRYELTEPVGVQGRFFIGWEHPATVAIPVGLDTNTDSGGEIYVSTNGTWEQNQNVNGSLMIRPVFGKGRASVIDGTEPEQRYQIFPNPNEGEFYLPRWSENISIVSLLGIPQGFTDEGTIENKRIKLVDQTAGVFIVRWTENGKPKYAKAIVRK